MEKNIKQKLHDIGQQWSSGHNVSYKINKWKDRQVGGKEINCRPGENIKGYETKQRSGIEKSVIFLCLIKDKYPEIQQQNMNDSKI